MDAIQRRGWQIGSLVVLIAAGIVSIPGTLGILVARGRFIDIFANMGQELPVLTKFVLASPVLLVLPGLAVFLVVKECLPINPMAKMIVNLFGLAAAISFVAIYVIALFLPMMATMQSLR